MGGNALKKVPTRRYERAEFERLATYIQGELADRGLIAGALKYYRAKETFGDLDVVVVWNESMDYSQKILTEVFAPGEVVRNGEVISLNVEQLQVDFIHTPPELLNITCAYYDWNDLGNFMGRVAHSMGFKYGHRGLVYPVRSGTHLVATIGCSTEPEKIFKFLGFDYERWQEGFDTLEDIYEFVASSAYFNKEIYDFENLNHTNRTRNRKRASYAGFVEWLKSWDKPGYSYSEDLDEYVLDWDSQNGDCLKLERSILLHRASEAKRAKAMLVEAAKEIGYEGPALGKVCAYVSSRPDYPLGILLSTPSEIKQFISECNIPLNEKPLT